MGFPADCGNSVHPLESFSVTFPAVISGSKRQVVPPPGQEQAPAFEVEHCDQAWLRSRVTRTRGHKISFLIKQELWGTKDM